MISYDPLWCYLRIRGLKKYHLLDVISAPTIAKLGKNSVVRSDIIDKICCYLNCQPDDIMVYIPDSSNPNAK